MELKSKEEVFRKLQKQIKRNTKSIVVYKKISPVLMLLFVFNAFIMFYNGIKNVENSFQGLFVSLLVLIFLTLMLFHFFIVKKKKENKNLDIEIYKLLRL
jgi:hypothetical protein